MNHPTSKEKKKISKEGNKTEVNNAAAAAAAATENNYSGQCLMNVDLWLKCFSSFSRQMLDGFVEEVFLLAL